MFTRPDLNLLDGLLEDAVAVVSMRQVHDGATDPRIIGLRHDVDDNTGSLETAVEMARWEAERGYRSTFYLLHTAAYWMGPRFRRKVTEIAECGHEIGIHNDAITAQLETGEPAADILFEAVERLRGYGFPVISTVGHGNARCYTDGYTNDQLFVECQRPDYGDITRLGVQTVSLADLGLEFDSIWLHRGDYLSDSGGNWSQPFRTAADAWPGKGQLHMLVHPDHWVGAFEPEKAAA